MSRSHLQAQNGFCTAFIYDLDFGDGRVVRGTAAELAQHAGRSVSWVRDMARNRRRSLEGWTIVQVTRAPRQHRNAVIYCAENPREDPVIGDSEELASLIGYSPWYIRMLCRNGKRSRAGWTVRRATAEEAKQAREG